MMNRVRQSLKVKLMLSFTLVIIVIVASIAWFSYREISKSVKADIVKFSSQILKQANLNLERYYQEYEQGYLQLGTSREFEEWLKLDPENKFGFYQYYYGRSDGSGMQRNYILPLVFRHPEIMSITLKSDRGNEYHFTTRYSLLNEYSLDLEPWIKEADKTDKVLMRVVTNPYYLNEKQEKQAYLVMSMVKRFGKFNDAGYLKMDVSLEPVQAILQEIELGQNSVSMIADQEGQIIVHPDETKIAQSLPADWQARMAGQSNGSFFVEGTSEMVVFETLPDMQWKSIAVVDYPTAAGSVERVKTVTIAIAIAGLILALLLVYAFMTPITKRITRLRRMMKRTQLGDFSRRLPIDGNDELTDLSRSFNRMLEHLDENVQQLAESKMRQQKAVLSALQSQINSHFLYNALESIHSMAILSDHRDIEQTTVNLSNMLRYTSNYRDTIVTLQEEINHMLDYLKICRIRYRDALTFEIRMEKQCEEMLCLKALLQPMVENAVKHGIETAGESIHISISAELRDGQVQIRIQDNGQGFKPEVLRRLRMQLGAENRAENYEEIKQVGILNVNYRLNMYYLPRLAAIAVGNSEPRGAVVTLTFPAVRRHMEEGRAG
ncbi:sensor histidine kinase [Cohnella sp. CFH 77786]|uniref:cache domain-containing sensor histidine kinase n=1 Tax=Cohnella sp. CFH 77786 TaxID=2662265 RepID=UPI001C60B213|nr:sensor histidine kinase [Cohnella sp. CFH 77786]